MKGNLIPLFGESGVDACRVRLSSPWSNCANAARVVRSSSAMGCGDLLIVQGNKR